MPSYAQTILNDAPIGYWRLDETGGTVAHDLSPSGYNGSINGGVTLNQAGALYNDPDMSMLFNGSTGYITLPNGLNQTYSAFSVEMWVKATNLASAGIYRALISSSSVSTNGLGFEVLIAPTADTAAFYCNVGVSGNLNGVSFGSSPPVVGRWYHIVATYDGLNLISYLNGTITQSNIPVSHPGSISPAATVPAIGRDQTGSNQYAAATIDEVAIYNYALSPDQINNHYIVGTVTGTGGSGGSGTGNASITSRGAIQLLINDIFYPTIRQESINIARTANDPISTFTFTLQDDPSHIAISELEEIIFIDSGLTPNPAHNLLRNPVITPFTTNWTQTTATGGTFTQVNPGIKLTASNSTGSFGLSQNTQNGLIVPGQSYMLSCSIQTTALTALSVYLTISYLAATGSVINTQTLTIGTSILNTRYSVSQQAPAGATNAQVSFGLQQSSGTNSGNATFTSIQFEPMSFTTGVTQLSYPTPFVANGQPGCVLMPDGTSIRQYRLFGGLVTKATAGNYIGQNRQWSVTASGYAWLLQKQVLNNTFSNQTDANIFKSLINSYFANQFNTSMIATGATLDAFGYQYNGTMRDAADALASNSNFYYYIDAYRNIIYQPPGYNQLGFALSDTPDNQTSFPYYSYSLDLDATQLGNAVLVTGTTNISAIEYDAQSIGYYNQRTSGSGQFWRTVNDSTITTTNAARQRAIGEISQYNYARQIAHLSTQQMMIPGYTVLFSSATDGLNDEPMLIQKSTLILKGWQSLQTPTYECQCDIGAFNPDMVNISVKLLRKQLTNTQSIGTPTIGLMVTESTTFVDSITIRRIVYNPGTYNHAVYSVNTYFSTFPTVPTTKYGLGTWGNPANGYN